MAASTNSTAAGSVPIAHTITPIARYTLKCASQTSLEPLGSSVRLGPLDHNVAPFIPVAVVYTYSVPPTLETDSDTAHPELIPIERLRRAAERLLDYYPHLTGRLHIDPVNGVRSLDHLDAGAELFTARCSARLDEYCRAPRDGTAAPEALTAPFDPDLDAVFSNPVFTIQHTRFACGGVALGLRVLHTLTDAEGFFLLVRHLAELYRALRDSESESGSESGLAVLADLPYTQFYLSDLPEAMTPEERQSALDFQPSLFHLTQSQDAPATDVEPSSPDSQEPSPPPPVVGRVMRFSGRELGELKAHAMASDEDGWISTFDALTAHLFQRIYIARVRLRDTRNSQGVPPSSAATLLKPEVSRDILTSLNLRSPKLLNLPPHYFANALLTPYTSLPHTLLATGPLWAVARALHDTLTSAVSAHEAKETIRWMGAQPDKTRIALKFGWPQGSFLVSQWNKFDMYEGAVFDVDGQGVAVRPTLVSPPFTPISKVDGLVYYVATEERPQPPAGSTLPTRGNAAIDVYLTLSGPLWPILDQDKQFRMFRDI